MIVFSKFSFFVYFTYYRAHNFFYWLVNNSDSRTLTAIFGMNYCRCIKESNPNSWLASATNSKQKSSHSSYPIASTYSTWPRDHTSQSPRFSNSRAWTLCWMRWCGLGLAWRSERCCLRGSNIACVWPGARLRFSWVSIRFSFSLRFRFSGRFSYHDKSYHTII